MLHLHKSYASHTLRRTARLALAAILSVFAVLPATAQGPNITYTTKTTITNGLSFATSVAADSAGNVFVADIVAGLLYKETLNPDGTYTQSTITTGSSPVGVAIDASGNLYVADGAHNVCKETLSGGAYNESTVANTFSGAYRLAVDTSGDVYVLDTGTSSVYLEKPSGNTYTQSIVVGGLNVSNDGSGSGAVAVDISGNVYIADTGNSRVLKETLSSGIYTQSIVLDSTTYPHVQPQGIAVDETGAVLIANENDGIYKAVSNGVTYTTSPVVFASASAPIAGVGVSIDSHANLYIADIGTVYVNSANELAESSAENFGSANVGTATATQTATFTFDIGGTLATIPYAISTQGDLTLDFQAAATQPANVCVAGRTYNPGDTCAVAATFTPTRPGVRYGAIALFAPSGTPIATSYLQGIGVSPQVSFSPGTLNGAAPSTFDVSATVDSSNDVVYTEINAGLVVQSVTQAHPTNVVTPDFATGYTGTDGSSVNTTTRFGSGYVVDGAGNILFSDGYLPSSSMPGATSFLADDFNPTIPVQTTTNGVIFATNYGKAFLASVPFTSTTATPPLNNRPAVDGAGNLYFADDSGNQILEEQYIHGAYNNLLVVATGLSNPGDVVVDAAGAVYAADTGNNRIVREFPNGDGTYTQTIVDSGFASPPEGLAIDRLGSLYVSLFNNFQNSNVPFVVKETFAGNTYTRSNLTISGSEGLDVDAAGNVFALIPASSSSTFSSAITYLDIATPPSFIFDQTAVGSTSTDSPRTVTVTNNGNAPLNFTNIAITTNFTLSPNSTCPPTGPLAPGASCNLLINFVPTQGGVDNGTLTLTDDHLNAAGSTQVIHLNGQATGASAASATLSPSTYNYGSVDAGSSASQTFVLANTGTSSINIASTSLPNPVFTVSTATCGTSLAASATCTYTIVFKPSATGVQSTSFTVIDDAGMQTAALMGSGAQATAAQATLTPGTGNFGSLTVGVTSAATTFTLTNAGTAALSITSLNITGPNAASFQQGVSTCGSSLAAGTSCTVAITFAPASAGSFTAALSVADSVGTQSSTLTGTAIAAAAPLAVLTPATANFGSVTTGSTSAPQMFTLTNPGNAALTITGISLTGAGNTVFNSTKTCGTSLAAGASCTISIVFAPTTPGTDTATLTVNDNASNSPQTSALTGAATASLSSSDFSLSGTPTSQSVAAGSSAAYQIMLSPLNGSFTQPVTLSASGLPAGFTVTFAPASVTPGTSGAASTMTVTTATQQAASTPPDLGWRVPVGVLSAAILIFPFRRRRLLLSCLGSLLLVLCAGAALTGCGGGFAQPLVTQTYTVTVTGSSGSLQHSTSVQLTVK